MEVRYEILEKGFMPGAWSFAGGVCPAGGGGSVSEEDLTAPSAVLMEASTGKVLFEKNSHEVRACASITKVMTLLLVMEAIDQGRMSLTDTITASEHASSMGGSDILAGTGEKPL